MSKGEESIAESERRRKGRRGKTNRMKPAPTFFWMYFLVRYLMYLLEKGMLEVMVSLVAVKNTSPNQRGQKREGKRRQSRSKKDEPSLLRVMLSPRFPALPSTLILSWRNSAMPMQEGGFKGSACGFPRMPLSLAVFSPFLPQFALPFLLSALASNPHTPANHHPASPSCLASLPIGFARARDSERTLVLSSIEDGVSDGLGVVDLEDDLGVGLGGGGSGLGGHC
jgi:hypothetical protein